MPAKGVTRPLGYTTSPDFPVYKGAFMTLVSLEDRIHAGIESLIVDLFEGGDSSAPLVGIVADEIVRRSGVLPAPNSFAAPSAPTSLIRKTAGSWSAATALRSLKTVSVGVRT
jgi:hypothetical protein